MSQRALTALQSVLSTMTVLRALMSHASARGMVSSVACGSHFWDLIVYRGLGSCNAGMLAICLQHSMLVA